MENERRNPPKGVVVRYILIGLGCISVFLGVLGIFLPGLPTTPFLLLAAYLFARSSPQFYRLLLSNRYLGKYIRDYQQNRGLSKKDKIKILLIIAVMLSVSIYFIPAILIKQVVAVLGIIGGLVVLFAVPNARREVDE